MQWHIQGVHVQKNAFLSFVEQSRKKTGKNNLGSRHGLEIGKDTPSLFIFRKIGGGLIAQRA